VTAWQLENPKKVRGDFLTKYLFLHQLRANVVLSTKRGQGLGSQEYLLGGGSKSTSWLGADMAGSCRSKVILAG
jgi:hypothetical protein